MIRLAAVPVLLACAAFSGCGTISNMSDTEIGLAALLEPSRPATPFGGVANDLRWMARSAPPDQQWSAGVVVAALDMPLSLAGDIVTLPYTVPYWLINGVGQPAPNERLQQAVTKSVRDGEWETFWALPAPDPSQVQPDRMHGGIGPGW